MVKENKNPIIPIIIAGGSGTRLWPISTAARPKQFCNLIGDETLFQLTLKRVMNFPLISKPIVVCNKTHLDLVEFQSAQIKAELMQVIAEPFGKNTAPAVTLAALALHDFFTSKNNTNEIDPILLILPADHAIKDLKAFNQSLSAAKDFALSGHIICFGVVPDYPETGYGYIKKGKLLTTQYSEGEVKAYIVDKFIEKPNLKLAEQYLKSNMYFWNSGMLMCKRSVFLQEMRDYAEDIYLSCKKALENSMHKGNIIHLSEEKLSLCRSESIDRAMMELTDKAVVVSLDAGWSDLGSFASFESYLKLLNP